MNKPEKDNMILGTALVLIVFLLTLLAGAISENNTKVKIANTGLEECLVDPNSINTQTIWVKSCKDYLQAIKDYNED